MRRLMLLAFALWICSMGVSEASCFWNDYADCKTAAEDEYSACYERAVDQKNTCLGDCGADSNCRAGCHGSFNGEVNLCAQEESQDLCVCEILYCGSYQSCSGG